MMTERGLQRGCLDHARRDTDIPTSIITGRMPATISPIEQGSATGDGGPEVEVAPHRLPFKKRLRDIHKVKHSFRLIDDDDEDDHDYDSDAASHPPSLERQSASVYAVTESHQVVLVKQVSCRVIPRVQFPWKPSGPPPLVLFQQSNQTIPLSDCYKNKLHQPWSPLSRKSSKALYPSLDDLADCCEYQWKQQEVTRPPRKSNSFRKKACPSPTKKQCKKDASSSMRMASTIATTTTTTSQQQHQPTPKRVTPTEHSFAVIERPPQHPAGRNHPLPKQRSSLALAEPKECSRTSFEKLQKSDSIDHHNKNSQDRGVVVAPSRDRSIRRLASSTSKLYPPIETHHEDDESDDDEESEVEFQFQLPKFLRTQNGRDNVTVQSMMDILVIPPRRPPTPTLQEQSQSQSQSQRDIVFSPPQSNTKKMPPPPLVTNARKASICPRASPSHFRSADPSPSIAPGTRHRRLPPTHGLKSPPPSSIEARNPSSSQREICFPGAAGPPKTQLKSPPPFVGTTSSNHASLKQPPPHADQQYVPSTPLQDICLLPGPRQKASAAISQQARHVAIPAAVHREIRVLPASHQQILPPAASSRMRHSIPSPQEICLPGAQTQQRQHAYMEPAPQHKNNAHRRGSAPVIVSSAAAPSTIGPLLSPRPSPGCNKPSLDRYFSPTNNHQMAAKIYPPFSPVSASKRSAFVPPQAAKVVFARPAVVVNAFAPPPGAANTSTSTNVKTTNKFPTNVLCTPLSRRVSDLSMSSFQACHETTTRRQCFPDQSNLFEF